MPDRDAGVPRPPRAKNNKKRKFSATLPYSARVPRPASEVGPALEWCYENRVGQVQQFAFSALIVAVFLIILHGGFSWVDNWALWCVVLGTVALAVLAARRERYAAGADWLMHRKEIVPIYQLRRSDTIKTWVMGN